MASFNKVILLGNLTRDPELRYTPNGLAVCSFTLAVNDRFRGRGDGDDREETLFIDIVAFGKIAESSGQYLKKGRPALVEGRLKLEKWQSPEGQNRSKHSVTANVVQFLAGRDEGSGGFSDQPTSSSGPTETVDISSIDEVSDDEIPF